MVDEEFIQLLRDRNVIYTTTLVVFEGYQEVFAQQVRLTAAEYTMADPGVVSTLFDLRRLPDEDIPDRVLKQMKESRPVSLNSIAARNLKTLQDAGVTIAAGSDAGNIGTLHGPALFREFELMAETGLSPLQILRAATLNGARVMGQADQLGTIEEGKLADLLILNSSPLVDIRNSSDISAIIKNGHLYDPQRILPETPETIVQKQVNAYNARDLEAFVALYSPRVEIFEHPDKLLYAGQEQMRQAYQKLFASSPQLHCEIVDRIVLGNKVIDREKVTGLADTEADNAVAIYEVIDGLIARVWLIED